MRNKLSEFIQIKLVKNYVLAVIVFIATICLVNLVKGIGETYAEDSNFCPAGWNLFQTDDGPACQKSFANLSSCKNAIDELSWSSTYTINEEATGEIFCARLVNSSGMVGEFIGNIEYNKYLKHTKQEVEFYFEDNVTFSVPDREKWHVVEVDEGYAKLTRYGKYNDRVHPYKYLDAKNGYYITEWCSNKNCTSKVPFNTGIVAKLIYYSPIVIDESNLNEYNKWTATFDPRGGSLNGDSTKQCIYPSTSDDCYVAPLPTATKEGYTFEGWETSLYCDSPSMDILNLSNDTTYYACYTKKEESEPTTTNVTISFDAKGGSLNGDSTVSCSYTSPDTFCNISVLPTATKDGYTFKGWGSNSLCTSWTNKNITLSNNTIYYACYEKEEVQSTNVTATFNSNGGSLNGDSSISCSYTSPDTNCKISSLPTATKEGYTFKGWGSNEQCTSGSTTSLTLSNNTTYYACYEKEEVQPTNVTATFNSNGGKLVGSVTAQCSYTSPDTNCKISSLPTATKEGYTFKGWGSNEQCTSGSTTSLTLSNNTTYYACYEKEEVQPTTVTATFNSNGGKLVGSVTAQCSYTSPDANCKISSLPTATKDGYIFKGWATSTQCTNINKDYLTLNKNTTYYGCYEEEPKTTVIATFDANGGILNGNNILSCSYGSTENNCNINTLPSASKGNSIFKGWSDNKQCSSVINKNLTISSNKTYYACYDEIEETSTIVVATFDANGGILNGLNTIECSYTSDETSCSIDSLPSAVKEKHKFKGWSEEKQCTLLVENTIDLSSNKTYYACYEQLEETTVTATFDSNGGTIDGQNTLNCSYTTDEASCSLSTLPTATKDGHSFVGWSEEKQCLSGITQLISLNSDKTYYACYSVIGQGNGNGDNDIETNPETGSTLFYIVFIIGFLAFGYTSYYAYKIKKTKNN